MGATWPPDWAERVRGKNCPMCAQGRPADAPSPGRPLDFPEGERPEIPAGRLGRDALALRALV